MPCAPKLAKSPVSVHQAVHPPTACTPPQRAAHPSHPAATAQRPQPAADSPVHCSTWQLRGCCSHPHASLLGDRRTTAPPQKTNAHPKTYPQTSHLGRHDLTLSPQQRQVVVRWRPGCVLVRVDRPHGQPVVDAAHRLERLGLGRVLVILGVIGPHRHVLNLGDGAIAHALLGRVGRLPGLLDAVVLGGPRWRRLGGHGGAEGHDALARAAHGHKGLGDLGARLALHLALQDAAALVLVRDELKACAADGAVLPGEAEGALLLRRDVDVALARHRAGRGPPALGAQRRVSVQQLPGRAKDAVQGPAARHLLGAAHRHKRLGVYGGALGQVLLQAVRVDVRVTRYRELGGLVDHGVRPLALWLEGHIKRLALVP
mmetsp:Transcript_22931/g.58549  ORF Transcript_22931/g.58549 Transcript_22931/m.58549 type:complete len:373 (+) Transcript_22931:303-1421(+)